MTKLFSKLKVNMDQTFFTKHAKEKSNLKSNFSAEVYLCKTESRIDVCGTDKDQQ